jgi:threonine dehydratase
LADTRTPAGTAAVTADGIERAALELREHLLPTPLQYSRAFTAKAGCHVYLKIEGIQPTRAFKVRGALTKLLRMRPETRAAGVITASAGNHGQGVAFAAQAFRVPATVYVPNNANPLKVQAIKRMGTRVVHFGRSYNEAYLEALRIRETSGATFVHAFDDPDVVTGQGTIGVELLEQLPAVDTVLVPVGGGGLIAGIARYLKAHRPSIQVIGVEPAGANALSRSLAAGELVTLERVDTVADGLAASAPGDLTLSIARECVDRVLTVEEHEMLRAIRLYFEWEHLLAEPAGAAAMAALLYHYAPEASERVVVLLSGANLTDDLMMRALKAY